MDHDTILARLAPCGLHCGKCFAFRGGEISALSAALSRQLGCFEPYAARFTKNISPVFETYPAFKQMLDYFADAACGGCRKEKCKLYSACRVRGCAEKRGVDFCFQCPDFPCDHTGFDENLYQRHVAINEKMREIGPAAYYQEIKDLPRY